MSSFRITCFLLIATSLFCFSFIDTHSEQSISEDDYMFQQGNVFEYDVTFTYPGDSIVTFKRYYKIAEVNTNNDITKASLVYYSGSPTKQEKILCSFDVTRKNKLTVIDAVHLAAVYADDSIAFGKDKMPLNYPDSMYAERKFSNVEQATASQYFLIKTRGTQGVAVANKTRQYQNRWSVMGVEGRAVEDTATVILPFDTLQTFLTYYDVVRKNITITTSGGYGMYDRTEEVVKRIHIREWYHPLYGVVKREIDDYDEDAVDVSMSLRTIYAP